MTLSLTKQKILRHMKAKKGATASMLAKVTKTKTGSVKARISELRLDGYDIDTIARNGTTYYRVA